MTKPFIYKKMLDDERELVKTKCDEIFKILEGIENSECMCILGCATSIFCSKFDDSNKLLDFVYGCIQRSLKGGEERAYQLRLLTESWKKTFEGWDKKRKEE